MKNKILAIAFIFAVTVQAHASADSTQLDERLNPDFAAVETDYGTYPNVRRDKNHIGMNGDDWSALGEKYRAALAGDSLFTVVYLGDSHIQADFGGSVVRSRLCANRPAGRGLIIPFRLAGTNQPTDYSIATTSPFTASRLLSLPWTTTMPFTGIGLQPKERNLSLDIKAPMPTKMLRFHTSAGNMQALGITADGTKVEFDSCVDSDSLMCVNLPCAASDIRIELECDKATIGGIEMLSDSTGVLVHSIGNNGATYSDYSLPQRFGQELARLHPDLVIIALGTNEAFGSTGMETLQNNIDNLLANIRRHNPGTKVLLVGPASCFRRQRRGRRRASRQIVNAKVATVARTIREYAEENSIPYYNHFAVAGSAPSQRQAGLFSRDGVHYTKNGYRLWGNLLSDAILEAMKQ